MTGVIAAEPLVLTKPSTLSDITPWSGTDVSFQMSEELDTENFTFVYTMGSLTLDAPATPKWQIGRFTLPVDYYDYQTNYSYSDDVLKTTDVYAIGSFLNQRTAVEARVIETKIGDARWNAWTVFSVPYDVNFNDIQGGKGRWVIRRYDGANRAAVKADETWVDVKPGEMLHAYEAYIFQRDYYSLEGEDEEEASEEDHILTLPAAQTSNKQNIFASGDVVVPLKKYPAAMLHNADWNFVGNPYPCYYDLRAIKEHVIVYLWDDSQETFRSFDTRNDNGFVLAPCQGFFVQATDIEHLTFQASGRRILGKFHLPEPDDDEDDDDEEAAARSLAPKAKTKSAADSFNPENPGDPGANYYNPMTGEAYFDLFQPGRMNLAEELLLDNSRVQPEDVKILTVVAPMSGTDLFFSNYSNATRVDLGKSIGFTDIPAWSFTYMTKLKELILPSCVQVIDDDAFLYTNSIERFDIYATTPPTVGSKTFRSFNKENCIVRVPNEAVGAYKAAAYWKDFTIMSLEGGGEELQSVTLVVKTPDGQDLTSQCSILWHDADNNLLGVGSTLSAQPVGSTVLYSIGLPANIANLYVSVPEGTYTILSAGNIITITLEATGVVDLGGKQLLGSSGVLDVTFVASDSEAPTVFNSADLVLTIINKVSGQQITDFVLQYPNVLFEQTQLEPGQTLQLQVTSRSDLFQSTQTEVTVDATGAFRAELIIKEWGLANITSTPAEGVTDIMALVFDQNGKYVARFAANSTVVRVKNLRDGAYKVVLVQQNQFLNAVGSLDDLRQTLLREGEDYALLSVKLTAGTTSQYQVAVPALDMNRISHISTDSYIATNDPNVNIATSATLKAKVLFKEEYTSQVSNLQLIIDIPDGMQFVENSVISVGGSHQLSGQRLIIPCQQGEQVRWCLTSNKSGQKTVTALVQYILGGQQYLQPLGSAAIEVIGISLDVATTTNTPQINVQGTAFGGSSVTIYDGRAIVAKTTAKSDGSFSADITLNPALDGTRHKLYADIVTSGQPDFSTETSTILYDKQASVLNKVTMLYQNQRLTWNIPLGTVTPGYYSVNPESSPTATFTASFINPKPDCILDPYFEVVASDGSHRYFDATWDEASQLYTAVADYPEAHCTPADVQFLFAYSDSTTYSREEIFNAEVGALVSAHNQLVEDIAAAVEVTDVLVNEEDKVIYTFKVGDEPGYRLTAQMEDYDRVMSLQETQERPIIRTIEEGDTVVAFFIVNNEYSTTLYFANPAKHDAYSSTVDSPLPAVGRHRISFSGLVSGAVSGIKDFFAPTPSNLKTLNENIAKANGQMEQANQALEALNYIDEMQAEYDQFNNDLSNRINLCQYLLLARCPNGDLRVPSSMYGHFQSEIRRLDDQRKFLCRQMQGLILSYARALENAGYKEIVKELGKFIVDYAAKAKLSTRVTGLSNRLAATGVGTAAEFEGFINDGISGALDAGVDAIADQLFKWADAPTDYAGVRKFWESWVPKEYHKISMPLTDLRFSITASYEQCKEEEIDRPPVPWAKKKKRVRPIVDPSGYVYEGIEDNRVEGVTATIYYKENESATEQLWDAAEFGQENPLTTDAAGLYMWNVPQGLWQVRFQKEGYQPTQTAWLPVPPPQLEITVPMTQTATPAVVEAAAYADAVSIRFSQYMQVASLSDIAVRQNNIVLQGTLELLDGEDGLARTVRFLPSEKLTAKNVQLTVPATAKSYAGSTLAAAYTATLEVQHTIEGLVVQDGAAVEIGQTGYVTVTAYPAVAVAGKTLAIELQSPILELAATKIAFDDNGQALVPLRGLLPGVAEITFGVGDLQACAAVEVKYHLYELCSRPVASVVSGAVAQGTKVELYTATKGATIYYTTDGSCPCDEATRQRYTEPIVILSDVTIQAIAVLEGMTDSEVTTLTYTIGTGVAAPEVIETVEAEDFYYNLNGTRVMPPLPRGTFIHVQRTSSGQKSRKVRVK
jgi:hypothetical protein